MGIGFYQNHRGAASWNHWCFPQQPIAALCYRPASAAVQIQSNRGRSFYWGTGFSVILLMSESRSEPGSAQVSQMGTSEGSSAASFATNPNFLVQVWGALCLRLGCSCRRLGRVFPPSSPRAYLGVCLHSLYVVVGWGRSCYVLCYPPCVVRAKEHGKETGVVGK